MLSIDRLVNGFDSELDISGNYSFDEVYFKNTDIKELKDVSVSGKIYKDTDDKLCISMDLSGEMVLRDAISMDLVKYPFSIKLDDNLEEFNTNIQNSLDIMEILWQNIVLEVPLRYTNVDDTSKLQGDGWKLVSEEDRVVKSNPFSILLENEEEE